MRQKVTALVASLAWLVICAILVVVQIKVLQWSATHSPKEDPNLAKFAFFACAVSIVILVAEGVVRVTARFAVGVRKQLEWSGQYTDEDRRRYDEALRRYRQTQQAPPTEPAA